MRSLRKKERVHSRGKRLGSEQDRSVLGLQVEFAKTSRVRLEFIVWSALAALLALVLGVIKRPGGFFWSPLFDTAHVVLSGVAVVIGLRLAKRLLPQGLDGRLPYGLILACVVALGGCLEIYQLYGPGEASWGDLGRDMLGAFSTTLLAISFDSKFCASLSIRLRTIVAWSLRLIAMVLLCSGAATLVDVTLALVHRARLFPSLCGFESRWDRPFTITANGALLSFKTPPREFTRARGAAVGKVIFAGREAFPQFELRGGFGNWSAYETLAFEILSLEAEPVTLTLRVHDRNHTNEYSDRFNREFEVQPGQNSITVSIDDIRTAPARRTMDLGAIASVVLFADSPRRSFTLYFDEFRLQ